MMSCHLSQIRGERKPPPPHVARGAGLSSPTVTRYIKIQHRKWARGIAVASPNGSPHLMLTPQATCCRVLNEQTLNNRALKLYFDYKPSQKTLSLSAAAGSTRACFGIARQRNFAIRTPDIHIHKDIAGVVDCDPKVGTREPHQRCAGRYGQIATKLIEMKGWHHGSSHQKL